MIFFMITIPFLNIGATRAKSQRKKFDLNRIVAPSQTAVDKASKKRWPREQHRSGTNPISFHFTVFRDTVRRNKAMKCYAER